MERKGPLHRALRWIALTAAITAPGCTILVVPIPPPSASVDNVMDCPTNVCVDGGLIVTLGGVARPGSIVVVQNQSRALANGDPYAMSTFASRAVGTGDAGVNLNGRWRVTFGPVSEPAGSPVTISQHGDRFVVRSLVCESDGTCQQSNSVEIRIP